VLIEVTVSDCLQELCKATIFHHNPTECLSLVAEYRRSFEIKILGKTAVRFTVCHGC